MTGGAALSAASGAAPDAERTTGFRIGWCPGALRPMAVGDGLLARIKPRGHRLSLAQARGLADLARRLGNGALTITGRGNIQIRGLDDAGLPALVAGLDALGLLDRAASGEAVRNVVSNPLAGADPLAPIDLRPMVSALEERLSADPALSRLPAKFAWLVDEGGLLSLDGVPADVRFAAMADGAMAIGLAGDAARAVCPADRIVPVALRLADAYLALCADHAVVPHRIQDLVAVCGAAAVFERAGLALVPAVDRPKRDPIEPVGLHRHGPSSVVGASPAFGLLDAAVLDAIATRAATAGAADIRLTPWRGIVIPGLAEAAAESLAEALGAAGLIVDPADPRLAVAACVGAPACRRATTPVPADAARLAALLPRGPMHHSRLHVSGCAKGCARAGAAPITLVGEGGRYALVRDGNASGRPDAVGLSVEALVAMLGVGLEAVP